MQKKRGLLIALLSILGILIILGGLYIYSLSKIELQKVTVNELQNINLSGFTFGGNIKLYNGGVLPVGVKKITYKITLENSGNELGSGYIEGKTISAKQTADFPFSQEINWAPTSEVALGLITPGQTFAKVEGTVYVADLKITEFKVPFEMRVDLEQYIKQFAETKIQESLNKYGINITNVTGKLSDILGKVLKSQD